MKKDELTVKLFQLININEIVTASNEDRLLSYLNGIAERIISIGLPTEAEIDRGLSGERRSPQPVLAPRARENADGTRRREDTVRVSNL